MNHHEYPSYDLELFEVRDRVGNILHRSLTMTGAAAFEASGEWPEETLRITSSLYRRLPGGRLYSAQFKEGGGQ